MRIKLDFSFSKTLFFALTLALSACSSPPTPSTVITPTDQFRSGESPEVPIVPVAAQKNKLTINIKGDPSLQRFSLQSIQGPCLHDIKSFKTLLLLAHELDSSSQNQLKSQGIQVDGTNLIINHSVANITSLIEGFELTLPELPAGDLKIKTYLNNAKGNSLGSLSYEAQFSQSQRRITILLKSMSDEMTPHGCVPLFAEVTGAHLTSTSGELLVSIPEPSPNPHGGNSSSNQQSGTSPNINPSSSPQSVSGSQNNLLDKISRIEFENSNRYLSKEGESLLLKVKFYDASGNQMILDNIPIEWSSTRPQDFSVDQQGNVVALVGLGYSEIIAKVRGTNLQGKLNLDVSDPSQFNAPVRSNRRKCSSGCNAEPSPTPSNDFGFLAGNFNFWAGSVANQAMYRLNQLGQLELIASAETTLPDFTEAFAGNLAAIDNQIFSFFKVNGDTEFHLYAINYDTGDAAVLKEFDSVSEDPSGGVYYKGEIYFAVATVAEGYELWKTDGTSSGTVLVKNINSGAGNAFDGDMGQMTVFNDFLYFKADNGSSGLELWKTNGTNAGTNLVADLNTGASGSDRSEFRLIGNYLYIIAETVTDTTHAILEIDSSDTVRQVISNPSFIGFSGSELIGNNLYFYNSSAIDGGKIHVWNQSTKSLTTITTPDPTTHDMMFLGEIEDKVYFIARNTSNNNIDIYSTQGTNGSTQIEQSIISDGSSETLSGYGQQLNDKIIVSLKTANTGSFSLYLLTSSGFENITAFMTDQIEGGSGNYEFAFFGDNLADVTSRNLDRLYLTVFDSTNHMHTYFSTEGTLASTRKLSSSVDFETAQGTGNFETIASVFGQTYTMYYNNMLLPSYGGTESLDTVYFTLGFQ